MLSATEEDYQEAFFLWILSRGTAPWNRNSVAGTHSPRTPRPTQWVHAAGTTVSGHTNRADWTGLNAAGTTNPSGVPGNQVDGYLPDTSTNNKNNGWNHDSQFVLGRARRRRRARR